MTPGRLGLVIGLFQAGGRGGPAPPAWALVAHASTQSASGNVTPARDTTGANLLVAVTSQVAAAPTDSKANVWALAGHRTSASGLLLYVWYVAAPVVGAGHTFTNSSNGSMEVLAFSGAAAVPLDAVGAGADGATGQPLIPCGSLVTGVPNALVVAGYQVGDPAMGAVPAIDAGFSISDFEDTVVGSTWGGLAAWATQAAAGPVTAPTVTRPNNMNFHDQGMLVSFKAA